VIGGLELSGRVEGPAVQAAAVYGGIRVRYDWSEGQPPRQLRSVSTSRYAVVRRVRLRGADHLPPVRGSPVGGGQRAVQPGAACVGVASAQESLALSSAGAGLSPRMTSDDPSGRTVGVLVLVGVGSGEGHVGDLREVIIAVLPGKLDAEAGEDGVDLVGGGPVS
jgi:hypothetical protein